MDKGFSMLVEIVCDKLANSENPEGRVPFHKGLNAVVGTKSGDNSIGKSSMLLLIDFAFGGSSYADWRTGIVGHVGNHEVCFTHAFEGKLYRFRRSTGDERHVATCDELYRPVGRQTNDEFCDWLLRAYSMGRMGGTFRGLMSPFIQIWRRLDPDITQPLLGNRKESARESIERLVKLFERYDEIAHLKAEATKAAEAQKTFAALCGSGYVVPASGSREYERNEEEVQALDSRLQALMAKSSEDLLDLDALKAERLSELKSELSQLRRARTRLISELTLMEEDLGLSSFRHTASFKQLEALFPGVNLARVEELEAFHRKLCRILKEECEKERKLKEAQLANIDDSISELEAEVREFGSISSFSKAVFDEYSRVERKRAFLEKQNEAFMEKEALKDAKKEADDRLSVTEMAILEDIASTLNSTMGTLNDEVSGGRRAAPEIEFKSPSSYTFGIPHDRGTGAGTSGMYLLDAALLMDTKLPFVIHDTVNLKQIEDSSMFGLLGVYSRSEKQVFIAIDKTTSSDGDELPKVVKDAAVIALSPGRELFGISFANPGKKS